MPQTKYQPWLTVDYVECAPGWCGLTGFRSEIEIQTEKDAVISVPDVVDRLRSGDLYVGAQVVKTRNESDMLGHLISSAHTHIDNQRRHVSVGTANRGKFSTDGPFSPDRGPKFEPDQR